MSDEKYAGAIAAAKNAALTKAALEKKLDKSGGTVTGSLEINGDMHAGGAVQSDLLLSAPSVAVHNGAGASVHINCSGDNAARITSLSSDGKSHYSRFAVGTPTGDNDAATKAYVDSKAKKDFVVNITFDSTSAPAAIDDSNIAVFNAITDKTFAEISSAVAAGENVYGMWNGHKWPLYLSSPMVHAFRGSVQLDKVFGSVGLAIANCAIYQNGCTVTASAGELPAPALDGTDDGKGIVVSGGKWTMKKDVVDTAMSDTSTNPVQNKAVKAAIDVKADKTALDSKADKSALDDKLDKSGGTLTGNLTGKYITGTWLQSTAAANLGKAPGKIAVLDGSGWVYYRTPSELFADLGIANAIKSYVDTAIIAAINSSY